MVRWLDGWALKKPLFINKMVFGKTALMKKLLILSLFAALCWQPLLYSQLQPKTLFAAGDWSFRSDPGRNSLQDYSARAGILIDENLTLGGFVGGQQFNRFNSSAPNVNTGYAGLFTRYFFKGNGPAVPFLAGEAFLGSRTFNFDVDELDFNRNLWGVYLGAGIDWFLSPSAAIEGQAGVQRFEVAAASDAVGVGEFGLRPPAWLSSRPRSLRRSRSWWCWEQPPSTASRAPICGMTSAATRSGGGQRPSTRSAWD